LAYKWANTSCGSPLAFPNSGPCDGVGTLFPNAGPCDRVGTLFWLNSIGEIIPVGVAEAKVDAGNAAEARKD